MMSSPSITTNGSSPTCLAGYGHGVAEPERLALADVVEVGHVGDGAHLLQLIVLAPGLEVELELERAVEVVLERALARVR